jgi:spore germination cell wall hydrolase CwlJ-like protein
MVYKICVALAAILISMPITSNEVDAREGEIECLARNMYYEARGEGTTGMIAVGHVTMNRVESKGYPSTVCGVVTQKHRKTCQFSWVCNRNLPAIRDEQYEKIRAIAVKLYDGQLRDITKGATHFHNTKVEPAWVATKKVTAQIGSHIFYRKKNA